MLSFSRRLAPLGLKLMQIESSKLVIGKRGVRATKLIFRDKIPRYKKDLTKLPALTGLLTAPETQQQIGDAIELRKNKLAVYKEYLPVNANTNLIEALFHPDNDIDRLLRLIDQNLMTMTSFYLSASFEAIDDMMRANLCDPATVAVSPEFEKLCSKTMQKMRFFESDEVLKLIKCLSTMKAPENALIVQAALQMARHLINDFTSDELDSFTKALEGIEPNRLEQDKSLLKALKQVKNFKETNKLLT